MLSLKTGARLARHQAARDVPIEERLRSLDPVPGSWLGRASRMNLSKSMQRNRRYSRLVPRTSGAIDPPPQRYPASMPRIRIVQGIGRTHTPKRLRRISSQALWRTVLGVTFSDKRQFRRVRPCVAPMARRAIFPVDRPRPGGRTPGYRAWGSPDGRHKVGRYGQERDRYSDIREYISGIRAATRRAPRSGHRRGARSGRDRARRRCADRASPPGKCNRACASARPPR